MSSLTDLLVEALSVSISSWKFTEFSDPFNRTNHTKILPRKQCTHTAINNSRNINNHSIISTSAKSPSIADSNTKDYPSMESSIISQQSSSTTEVVRDIGWKNLDKKRFYFLIPFGSLSVRFIVFPFSLLKTTVQTRLITAGGAKLSWAANARSIFVREGILGFYKGFGVSLFGLINGPIYTTAFETSRELISEQLYHLFPQSTNDGLLADYSPIQSISALIAGFCATTVVQFIQCPIDIISQRRMIAKVHKSASNNAQSPLNIFRSLIATQGYLSLWQGMFIAIMTYAPTSASVWALFMLNKSVLYNVTPDNTNPAFISFIGGGSAGLVTAWLTMPLDTLRSRKQVLATRETRVSTIFKEVVRAEGIKGLWTGVTARMTSHGISSACLLTAYEMVKRMAHVSNDPEENHV